MTTGYYAYIGSSSLGWVKMDENSIYGKFHWTHKSDFFNFSIRVPIHKKKSRDEITIITETGKTLESNDTICDSPSLSSFIVTKGENSKNGHLDAPVRAWHILDANNAECTARSPMPILRHIAPCSNQRHHPSRRPLPECCDKPFGPQPHTPSSHPLCTSSVDGLFVHPPFGSVHRCAQVGLGQGSLKANP